MFNDVNEAGAEERGKRGRWITQHSSSSSSRFDSTREQDKNNNGQSQKMVDLPTEGKRENPREAQ